MSTASFNPRTVLSNMFVARGTEQRFFVSGKTSPTSTTLTSEGVADSSQGANVTFDTTASYPWYMNINMHNIGDLQRHSNSLSMALHFNRANMALIANCNFQELLPGGSRAWRLQVNRAALAVPDQSYTFNTATPDTVLYTSGNSLWQAAAPVFYPGDMARFNNPLQVGTKTAQGGAGDKTVMKIKGSSYPNEFRVSYEFYTVAGGASPTSEIALSVNGSTGQIMGFTVQGAVGTAISAQGAVTRRRDYLYGGKASYVNRAVAVA